MSRTVRPRFEVHKLKGKGVRHIASPKTDKEGKLLGGFEYEDKEVPAGWMVYFPNGSSVHIWTEEEMERCGFLADPTLIDMESGEEVPQAAPQSLKSRSEQKETVTVSNKAHAHVNS